MRAADEHAMDHAWQPYIFRIYGPPGDFLYRVHTNHSCANCPIVASVENRIHSTVVQHLHGIENLGITGTTAKIT